jgi:hypothetical protein
MTQDQSNATQSNEDGLLITFDEETSTFTFDWNPETHPKYDYLTTLSSDELLHLITKGLEEALEEDALLHQEDTAE